MLALPGVGEAHAAKPKLKVRNVSVSEPVASEAIFANFKVTLSARKRKPVGFRFRTVDGSAKAGSDYVARSGRARIKRRKRATTIRVRILKDAQIEPTERFGLRITRARGAAIKKAKGVARIRDSKPADPLATTPYEINDGTVPPGTLVSLPTLTLTAYPTTDNGWAGLGASDPEFDGIAGSALELDLSKLSPGGLTTGWRLGLTGIVKPDGVLAVESVSVVDNEPNSQHALHEVTPAELTSGHGYDNVFVRLSDVVLASISEGRWTLTNGIGVAPLVGSLPDQYAVGTAFASIRGIADTRGATPTILPRIPNDIEPAPVELAGLEISGDCFDLGGIAQQVGTVTLSGPAPSDTLVSMLSSDESVVAVGAVTVPAGSISALVFATTVGAGTATLTASLDGVEKQGDVTVGAPCP